MNERKIIGVILLLGIIGIVSTVLFQKPNSITELCSSMGMDVEYINGIPTCKSGNTLVAYPAILEETIASCDDNCKIPEVLYNGGLLGDPKIIRGNNKTFVVIFWGKGCPHCAKAKPFLEELQKKYNFTLVEYEVYYNSKNSELFSKLLRENNISEMGVPTIVVGKYIFMGYLSEDELEQITGSVYTPVSQR